MKKVLFIGLGGIGQRHLRNVRQLLGNNAQLIALRRLNPDWGEIDNQLRKNNQVNIVDKYSILVEYDLKSALSHKPDATFISTPSSLHIDYAIQAVQAGSHVFIEKPLSNTTDGIDELESLVIKKNKVAYVGFQLRFNPVIKKLSQLIEDNSIGAVTSVRAEVAEYMPGFHTYEDYRTSYASRVDLGGGVVLTQIHELDYLQAIFGQPTSIYTLAGSSPSLGLDVEDVVSILMRHRLDNRNVPVSLHMDFCQRPTRRSCLVYAEGGEIRADLVNRKLVKTDINNFKKEYSWNSIDRNQQFIDEVTHFFDCIDSCIDPVVNLAEGKKSLLMALAAKNSMSSGQPVNLI